jgi:hypothetical protein
MNKLQSKGRCIFATRQALKGNMTGRDIAAITRYQLTQSSFEDWSDEELGSVALSIMVAVQIQFN